MKKYPLRIYLRQPPRMIRMGKVTESELESLLSVVGASEGKIHGPNKAGKWVVIPTSNVAYIEADTEGATDEDES